ncbi:MAG: DUF2934 domain-containing protein [Bryobacteraceae bacterium]|jgi:hypothetical protein
MSSTSATRQVQSETLSQCDAALDPQLNEHDGTESAPSLRDRIALLAYSYWEERGCPFGSPEDDWLRAEQEICGASDEPGGFPGFIGEGRKRSRIPVLIPSLYSASGERKAIRNGTVFDCSSMKALHMGL